MRNPKATLIYRWFQEVWNDSREELIDELMTKDATTHGIVAEGQPKGAPGFKIFYHAFNEQFHDIPRRN